MMEREICLANVFGAEHGDGCLRASESWVRACVMCNMRESSLSAGPSFLFLYVCVRAACGEQEECVCAWHATTAI